MATLEFNELKQWFLQTSINTYNLGIFYRLCKFPVVDLVCLTFLLQMYRKDYFRKVEKESKLVKVVVIYNYWR